MTAVAVTRKHKSCSFTAFRATAAAVGEEIVISVTQMWSVEIQNIDNKLGGVFLLLWDKKMSEWIFKLDDIRHLCYVLSSFKSSTVWNLCINTFSTFSFPFIFYFLFPFLYDDHDHWMLTLWYLTTNPCSHYSPAGWFLRCTLGRYSIPLLFNCKQLHFLIISHWLTVAFL